MLKTSDPSLEPCPCPICKHCAYPLFNKISRFARLCFSCRHNLHAGRPPQ